MKAKVKQLSILFIDLILYSVLIDSSYSASFHHYPEIGTYQDCSARRFAADFFSAADAVFNITIIPYFVFLYLISEKLIVLLSGSTFSANSRAPPIYARHYIGLTLK